MVVRLDSGSSNAVHVQQTQADEADVTTHASTTGTAVVQQMERLNQSMSSFERVATGGTQSGTVQSGLQAGLATPRVHSGRSINITAVAKPSEFDINGVMESLVRLGEVRCHDVESLIANVQDRAGEHQIKKLTIIGHGGPGVQSVGDEYISIYNIDTIRPQLEELTPYFAEGAEVTLDGCFVGRGEDGQELLQQLANIWGVRVRAGVSSQNVLPGIEGREIIAYPQDENGQRLEARSSILGELWVHFDDFRHRNVISDF